MLLKKRIRKLKDCQKTCLSIKKEEDLDKDIWNPDISNCFKAPNKNNILDINNCNFNRYKVNIFLYFYIL